MGDIQAARAESMSLDAGMLLMQNMQSISRSPVSLFHSYLHAFKITCD